jgi:NarL family two-component system response regulator LiaR
VSVSVSLASLIVRTRRGFLKGKVIVRCISVLIVDDHPVVRQGLRAFLDSEEDIEVVGEAGDGAEAVRKAGELRPDVVLMDLVLPGMDGVASTLEIRKTSPSSRVLVLTSFGDNEKVFPAIKAGAMGYLLKDSSAEDLGRAIRSVAHGEFLLHPDIAKAVIDEFSVIGPEPASLRDLTPREIEVLTLIARGCSNKEIASHLCISIKTVKTHVSNILSKLRVTDRTEAAVYAVRQGLVNPRGGDEA